MRAGKPTLFARTWRVVRFLLKYTFVVLVSLAVLALVAAGIAWEYPDLWLREPTLARAARALRPTAQVDWATASVDVEKDGFFVRKFAFEFGDLRVTAGPVAALAKTASLDLTLRIGWNGVTVEVDDLRIDGKSLTYVRQSAETPEPATTAKTVPFRVPPLLSHVGVRRVSVAFEDARVTVGKTRARFGVSLEARPDGRGVQWDLGVAAKNAELGTDEIAADAEVRLTSLAGPWFGPYAAKIYLRLRDRTVGTATLTAAGTPALEGTSSFRGSVTATLPSKVRVRSAFTLALSSDRLDFAPSGRVLLPSGPLAEVDFARCPVSLPLPVVDLPKSLHCFGKFRSRDPKERWNGQEWRLEASERRWSLTFDDLVGVKSANARLVLEMQPASDRPLLERKCTATFDAKVGDYAALARRLYPGELSIPQPFAALAGDVDLRADWTGQLEDFAENSVTVTWKATTKLASPQQRFRTVTKGSFIYAKNGRPDLEAESVLEDVALDLPDMNLSPIRVMPDSRIRPFDAKSDDEEPGLRYRIAVKTIPGKPLTLKSNLAQGPIPVALDLLLSDDRGPRGSITVLSFPVEMFKRRGELDHLQIAFAAKGGHPVVDGAFRVKYAEYVITLKAIGPADKPTFEVSSEPPLPERDVWAALLFGRKLETGGKDTKTSTPEPRLSSAPESGSAFASRLSNDDARSAAEMQAAAVDGGLSLATMYLLASTPVESVSYNPATHELRAAVRLADGAAITVGGDLHKNTGSVGFRYRLGNNWYVTTTLEDVFDTSNPRLGTRLEWSRRY